MRLVLLALVCVAAYLPTLWIPLVEDDYPNLAEAQVFGSLSGQPALFHNSVCRHRATSYWLMLPVWRFSRLDPVGYHAASLLLHIVCTWLLFALCRAWLPMRDAAFWTAAFFAVQEGHQEAVMWFSAMNEPLQFLFGVGALLCWTRAERWTWNAAGTGLFALALLSKESAVIVLPLFLLVDYRHPKRLIPYVILGLIAVLDIAGTRTFSTRFTDGSFSLHAPFWITWPRGMARLLWVWGLLASAAILIWGRESEARRAALLAFGWMSIAFVPYSLLTYSTQIPSRQTYLASAGLAMLVGEALVLKAPFSRRVAAVFALSAAINITVIATRKRRQFEERADPTEQLIALARHTTGPIFIRCFPRQPVIAEAAVQLAAGRPPGTLAWTREQATAVGATADFCYPPGK
jgi:hypothetical protein